MNVDAPQRLAFAAGMAWGLLAAAIRASYTVLARYAVKAGLSPGDLTLLRFLPGALPSAVGAGFVAPRLVFIGGDGLTPPGDGPFVLARAAALPGSGRARVHFATVGSPMAGGIMDIKAVAFDTGGTVLDWHGGVVRALERVGAPQGAKADWHAVANDWRRRTMKGIVGQVRPVFHMDDVHRRTLDETLAHFGLQGISAEQRHALWRTWHELDAWPDFPAAAATLRSALPVVSLTMLPTALVVDVSRRNGLVWDAVISCEMIGVYKPHAEAYTTAARWLALQPAQILMVACHNFDLNAAHQAGMRTAFVRRPDEWGPEGPPDPKPNMAYDYVEDGFDGLVRSLLVA
jgi:2-haloacid dehalogenase